MIDAVNQVKEKQVYFVSHVEVRVRKGKVKRSAVWLMLAVLTTCVLSATVMSGENPWDSDHRPTQSGSPGTSSDTTCQSNTRIVMSAASAEDNTASIGENGWMRVVHQVLMFVARHQAEWLRSSGHPGSKR